MIYIFPTQVEAHPFREACPDAHIEICGVGLAESAANISAIIARTGDDEPLVLCGVAGSYSAENIAVGEVVEVIEERVAELPSRFVKSYCVEGSTSLRAVRSNSVNSSSAESCGADVENMEGASFMALCAVHSRRGVQIRAISNVVGEPFEQWRLSEAIEALALIVKEIAGRSPQ